MTAKRFPLHWLVAAGLLVCALPSPAEDPPDSPPAALATAPTPPDNRPASSGGMVSADVTVDRLRTAVEAVYGEDARKLLGLYDLVEVVHKYAPDDATQRDMLRIWEDVRGDFEAYSRQVAQAHQGEIAPDGRPVIEADGTLGYILPVNLAQPDRGPPIPPKLEEAFLHMIRRGGQSGIKDLIDSGHIDINANKLMSKMRHDIHHEVMKRMVQATGHEVHLDLFSIPELIRSDIDQALGQHVAQTWTNGDRQSIETNGAEMVQLYYGLFTEVIRDTFGSEFADIQAKDMDVVCHDSDARLPDPLLHIEDTNKFTAIFESAQRKLMLNPEAYFLEGAYRTQPDRRSYETDQRLHTVYQLVIDDDGKAHVGYEVFTARDKMYSYLRPDIRKAHAAGVAMGNWIFFRRHQHDSSLTTLMDQSKYPLRILDESVSLKAGENIWTFGGVQNMTDAERNTLIKNAFNRWGIGERTHERKNIQRMIEVAARLRAAGQGRGTPEKALQPYEDVIIERMWEKRTNRKLLTRKGKTGELNLIRKTIPQATLTELAAEAWQADAERFMLDVAVETAPDRIAEFIDPKVCLERLHHVANGRVEGAPPEAIQRAKDILRKVALGSVDTIELEARYRMLAETDLVMIGLMLRNHAPDHYQRFMQKFEIDSRPELKQHFRFLIFQEEIANLMREPYAFARRNAVLAKQAAWEAFVRSRQGLSDYLAKVQVQYDQQGPRLTAEQVLSDLRPVMSHGWSRAKGFSGQALTRLGNVDLKWGAQVAGMHVLKDVGIVFPAVEASIKSQGPAHTLTSWRNWEFDKKAAIDGLNVLGFVDGALEVALVSQMRGGWDDVVTQVFWSQVASNTPLIGPIYDTLMHASMGNVFGLIMEWGPVYIEYAYTGTKLAAASSTLLLTYATGNISWKLGRICAYAHIQSEAQSMFFGYDPADDQREPLLKTTPTDISAFDPAGAHDGADHDGPTPPAAILPEPNSQFEQAKALIARHTADMADGPKARVEELLQQTQQGDHGERLEAARQLAGMLQANTAIGETVTEAQLLDMLAPPLTVTLDTAIDTSSVAAEPATGVPADVHAIGLQGQKHVGLLDIVPGKSLIERRFGLYEWMENYRGPLSKEIGPFSVFQSVETEMDMFRKRHGLYGYEGESPEARHDRLWRAQQLQEEMEKLQGKLFHEKLELKSKALAVEFLRGDEVGKDEVFGSLRSKIHAKFTRSDRGTQLVLEMLTRLISEHYVLGMYRAKLPEVAQAQQNDLIKAQAAWIVDETMEQVLARLQREANEARSEIIWATWAMPETPPIFSLVDLDLHLDGDLPGVVDLKETHDTEVSIVTPDHPIRLGSLDAVGVLNLEAKVKTRAQAYKRPFRYAWNIGGTDASLDPESDLYRLRMGVEPGRPLPVSVTVYDKIGRTVGSATEELELGPTPLSFEEVVLLHRDEPDNTLFAGRTLDAEQTVASGHGYQLDVKVQLQHPVTGFRQAGVGLLPASVLDTARKYLADPPDPEASNLPDELSMVDTSSLMPAAHQFLWHHLEKRARGQLRTADGADQPAGTSTLQQRLSIVRESDTDDDYYLFAIAEDDADHRHFVVAPGKLTLISAETPRLAWKTAMLTRQSKKDGPTTSLDLLKITGVGVRPTQSVMKGRTGTIALTAQASTGGEVPESFQIGFERANEEREFDPATFTPIASGVQRMSDTEFAVGDEWDAAGVKPGLYQIVARVKMPDPVNAFFVSERLTARTTLYPIVRILPDPDALDALAELARSDDPPGGDTTGDDDGSTATGPADADGPDDGGDSGDDDDGDDDDGDRRTPGDSDDLEALTEELQTKSVTFDCSLSLNRIRRDGRVTPNATSFARATAVQLVPHVQADGIHPGMKVRLDVGYIEAGKRRALIGQTVPITGDQGGQGRFTLDLAGRANLQPRWVGRQIWRGQHLAYLHVYVISPTGRFQSAADKQEIAFEVKEEGIGEPVYHDAYLYDRQKLPHRGTRFWDDAKLEIAVPYEITEVYGNEPITVRHRFGLRSLVGRSFVWKNDDVQQVRGAGRHLIRKSLRIKGGKYDHGKWTVEHEIVDVTDADGIPVLKPGQDKVGKTELWIVRPRVVFKGSDVYQLQHPPADKAGTPVTEFLKASDTPVLHMAFHVDNIPEDCEMGGMIEWISPDTGTTRQPLPKVANLSENMSRRYWGGYSFKKDDHDNLYTAQATITFGRKGDKPKVRQGLKLLPFRFKGRERPGATLVDITVPSRTVEFGLYDNGSVEDDWINVYVNNRLLQGLRNHHLRFRANQYKGSFKISAGQDAVVFTIEHVRSDSGPNTAAVQFTGAIEVSLRQQSWHIAKVGQKASCVITYKPPDPTSGDTGNSR